MSLFQCQVCGCVENTALAAQGFEPMLFMGTFSYAYAPEREGKLLCSACGPTHYRDGKPTGFGKWHGEFDRTFLPLGEFKTNKRGNLEHIATGSEDYKQFAIDRIQLPKPFTESNETIPGKPKPFIKLPKEAFAKAVEVTDSNEPPTPALLGLMRGDYVDPQRAKFKELAREAALECYVKYGYLPANKAAAENWHPHVWVTDAMKKACASESERAHIAELRADTAEADLAEMTDNFNKVVRQKMKLSKELATAEQCNADLLALLRDTKTMLASELSYELYHNIAVHMKRIDAALNPNPEAESHD